MTICTSGGREGARPREGGAEGEGSSHTKLSPRSTRAPAPGGQANSAPISERCWTREAPSPLPPHPPHTPAALPRISRCPSVSRRLGFCLRIPTYGRTTPYNFLISVSFPFHFLECNASSQTRVALLLRKGQRGSRRGRVGKKAVTFTEVCSLFTVQNGVTGTKV